jgi:hypothetical protein
MPFHFLKNTSICISYYFKESVTINNNTLRVQFPVHELWTAARGGPKGGALGNAMRASCQAGGHSEERAQPRGATVGDATFGTG